MPAISIETFLYYYWHLFMPQYLPNSAGNETTVLERSVGGEVSDTKTDIHKHEHDHQEGGREDHCDEGQVGTPLQPDQEVVDPENK